MEGANLGCVYNYVVTAHKPTAVTHALVGHFTSPKDTNLIVGKSTRIEIHTLAAEGLQGVVDVPIYGRIATMQLLRPPGNAKDLLFFSTEKYRFCVLEYDSETGELVTRAGGDLHEKIGRPSDHGQIGIIDPACRMIGLHLYDGLLKVIPIGEGGQLSEAFNIRLEELAVVDMKFLHGCATPTVALLYEDVKHSRHIKTYEVYIKDKELRDGPWAQNNLDNGARMIIPLPGRLQGVLVVGEDVISYVTREQQAGRSVPSAPHTAMTAYGAIDEDGSRYLLGDMSGGLHLLVVVHDGERVVGLKLQQLGRTSIPSSLCYLDNGVVFAGSTTGDSQLLKLHATPFNPADPTNFVEVLDSFSNLAPIVDFAVVDLERQGQGQVVTCSGVFTDGSLRVIRNGIGIEEQATVELAGIKGVWSLREHWMDAFDTYLVLTFVGETRVLAINAADELDEAELAGFDTAAYTVHTANTLHDQLLQATAQGVRLIDCQTKQMSHQWQPPTGLSINVAASSPTQVLLATGEGHLVYLEIGEGASITERGHLQMPAEVACVDITPLGDDTSRSSLAVVGTWGMQLMVYELPSLTLLTTEAVGGEVIPRSVLLSTFEGFRYLLCGLGDGQLFNWRIDPTSGALSERKSVVLGTKPIVLRAFRSSSGCHVFAATDRPTVIYSSNKKLLYSNLNESEINFMASFNSSSFPDSLAIVKEGSMMVGRVDDIQKLHVRTVPLGEQPRRIVHQESTRTFGVLTMASKPTGEASFVRVLDDSAFDVVASFDLDASEMPQSINSMSFADDPATYYVVGTAYVKPEEAEPTKGRLLVLLYEDGKLQLISEKEMKGCVYNVLPFQGKLLISLNSRISLLRWMQRDDMSRELEHETSHMGHVLALYLATRGDFIIVGDLMRSIELLQYNAAQSSIDLLSKDANPAWMTAIAMLDDDTYLGAENSFNLFTVRKLAEATTDEERGRLEVTGEFHLGEFVNRFRQGSLVMRLPDSELSSVPTLLFGTVDGVLGVVASIPQEQHAFLTRLQDALRKVIKGVGGLDHAQWRAFANERVCNRNDSRNFVDGDLIEQLLDLKGDKLAEVAAIMGGDVSPDELYRRVEELSRLH